MQSPDALRRRAVGRLFLLGALLAGGLFIPAGTLAWTEAWVYIVLQIGYSAALSFWLLKRDPVLLEKRMEDKLPVMFWDKIISILFLGGMPIYFATLGLDVVRYGWSTLPAVVEGLGFAGILAAMAIVFFVMKENTFLIPIVEIQKERGHSVITTGPYRFVRHPMYVAVILWLFSLSLAMGSLYGLIPAFFLSAICVTRTAMEDRTLRSELPGYAEYARKTPYKLLFGIW